MPAVPARPTPVMAEEPSPFDACAVVAGDWAKFTPFVTQSLTLPDGRPAFHSLSFLHNRGEARSARCDFVFESRTTEDDIDSWGGGWTERLALYSRDGRLLTVLARKVTDAAEIYHLMFANVQKGSPLHAALDAERRR